MSIDTPTTANTELNEAISRLQFGPRDFEAAKRSLILLAIEREELRKKIGTVDAAVELIRDSRDQ